MPKDNFSHSSRICIENGFRLLDDAEMLEYAKPPSSAFALAIIAQEEFAKGFLLFLVSIHVIPWNEFVWRATRDHTCKQLLGVIMDYLNPNFEEFLILSNRRLEEGRIVIPRHVADAINIFRHEKVRRWESPNWVWEEQPDYDPTANKIANGYLDRQKQNSLYVDVSKTGQIASIPNVLAKTAKDAIDQAKRMGNLVSDLLNQEHAFLDYEIIRDAFELLFFYRGNSPGEMQPSDGSDK